ADPPPFTGAGQSPLSASRRHAGASRFFSLSQSGERQERCASEPLPKTAIPISIRSTAWRLVAGELRRGLEDPDTAASALVGVPTQKAIGSDRRCVRGCRRCSPCFGVSFSV